MNDEIKNCIDVVQEECAEVIKVLSKVKRFGLNNHNPYDEIKKDNLTKLAEEYGDLMGSISKLISLLNVKHGDPFWGIVMDYAANKPSKIDKYYALTKELDNYEE